MKRAILIFTLVFQIALINKTYANSDDIQDMAFIALNIAQPNSFKNNIEYCAFRKIMLLLAELPASLSALKSR